MFTQSGLLKFLCLSVSMYITQCSIPVLTESRPPPNIAVLEPASLPFYGPQVPYVSASVKSPPIVVQPAPQPLPLPPVQRGRIGVKTVVRPVVVPPRPAPIFEPQQEVIEPRGVPEPYNFNFDVKDDAGNGQYRREEGDTSGVVRGSYGYTDAYGLYRIVDYVADQDGFRASIRSNEPGLVEPNPVSGVVENPAEIRIAAEETPARVKELIRLVKPNSWESSRRAIRAPTNDIDNKYVSKD